MHRKYTTIILVLLLLSFAAKAGNGNEIDSLTRLLRNKEMHDTSRVKTLNALAWKIKYSNPDSAISLSKKALELGNKQGWSEGKAEALHHLGAFQYLKGKHPVALDHYQKALGIYRSMDDKKGAASILSNIGLIHGNQGNANKALESYFKALNMNKELGNKSVMAINLNNIGNIHIDQGSYPKALDHYLRALKLNKELGNKSGIASNMGNIGNVYLYQNNYPKAKEYYLKALEMNEKLGNKMDIAVNLGNIGIVSMNRNNFHEAYEYYRKALNVHRELGNKKGVAIQLGNFSSLYSKIYTKRDSLRNAFVEDHFPKKTSDQEKLIKLAGPQNAGEILLDSAIASTRKSFKIRRKIGDKLGVAACLNSIGKILIKKGRYREALEQFHHAYTLADSIGALPRKKIAAHDLFRSWEELGNTDSALFWHKRYTAHKDSIYNQEKQKALGKQEARFEWQQKLLKQKKEQEKQEAIAEERQERQQVVIYSVSGGLVLVLAFLGLLYNRFRTTRKQKHIIEEQKQEVDTAYSELHEKNREITDSINYAQLIQQAILPSDENMNAILREHFVLFEPHSTVSGDFYWAYENPDSVKVFTAADCTGHGVPGAFMSMIGNSLLDEMVVEKGMTNPGLILDMLKDGVIKKISEEGRKDGMDMGLCSLTKEGEDIRVQFAGANNPIYMIRKGIGEDIPEIRMYQDGKEISLLEDRVRPYKKSADLLEIKGDPMAVGFEERKEEASFTTVELTLRPGDTIYTFSDGYADQFGGPKGKKFSYGAFKRLLLSMHDKSMEEQKKLLEEEFRSWKGTMEQVDDVCVIGVRLE